MKLQPINNYQQSFCAIYQSTKVPFTPKQNEVIDDIMNKLRKPMLRFNNKSAEEYYKTKKDIDFAIGNINRNENTVYLEGWYNTKDSLDDEQLLEYKNAFFIGIYGPDKKFNVSDVKKMLLEEIGLSMTKYVMIPTIALLSLLGLKTCEEIREPQNKPLTEKNCDKHNNNNDNILDYSGLVSKNTTFRWHI